MDSMIDRLRLTIGPNYIVQIPWNIICGLSLPTNIEDGSARIIRIPSDLLMKEEICLVGLHPRITFEILLKTDLPEELHNCQNFIARAYTARSFYDINEREHMATTTQTLQINNFVEITQEQNELFATVPGFFFIPNDPDQISKSLKVFFDEIHPRISIDEVSMGFATKKLNKNILYIPFNHSTLNNSKYGFNLWDLSGALINSYGTSTRFEVDIPGKWFYVQKTYFIIKDSECVPILDYPCNWGTPTILGPNRFIFQNQEIKRLINSDQEDNLCPILHEPIAKDEKYLHCVHKKCQKNYSFEAIFTWFHGKKDLICPACTNKWIPNDIFINDE
jgi:hypothetical protein